MFILLILGTVIFLLYQARFKEGQVFLKIEVQEEAASGEEIEYKVIVENRNNFNLTDSKLSFFYPEDSTPLRDGEPLDSLLANLDLGTFEQRSEKEFLFKAIITGEKGENKKAKAVLTYSPSNFRSVFQKTEEAITTISRVSVSVSLSAPPNILSGQTVTVFVDLRNETEKDLQDLQLALSYPEGFIFKKAMPSPNERNGIFNIASIKAGEGVRVSVEGEISGFEKEGKTFSAVLRKKTGDQFFDLQKSEVLLTISSPLIRSEVLINDSKSFAAKAGDRLKYTIKFSNDSNYNFSALELRAALDGQMFDFATLKTNDGFFDQNSRTILWNAAASDDLGNLPPRGSGEVSFEVNVKQDFPKTFGKSYSLKVTSLIQISSVPPDFDLDKVTSSAEMMVKVGSKVSFTAKAFYNDQAVQNSGPVPPRVGQKTTYTIHWKIVNEGNDLTNARVESFLPPGVSWENEFKLTPSQSQIRYDPSLGRVSWLITTVPAGTGAVSNVFEAIFQIGITPSINQVGQAPEITKESSFEATDNFTKEKINLSQPAINTQTVSDSPGTVAN